MLLCKVHNAFRTALGVACPRISTLRRISLSGPTVSTSFSSSLHSWPLFWVQLHRPLVDFVILSSPTSGSEIMQWCQFIHGLFRSLGHLPGGLTRLIPCWRSVHFTRLTHLGWTVWAWHAFQAAGKLWDASHPGTSGLLWLSWWGCFEAFQRHCEGSLFQYTLCLAFHLLASSRLSPEVGTNTVSRIHLLDHDPSLSRPVKRLRICGKVSACKLSSDCVLVLPTPERWKRLIPPGSGERRDEVLVDALVSWRQRLVAAGKAQDAFRSHRISCTLVHAWTDMRAFLFVWTTTTSSSLLPPLLSLASLPFSTHKHVPPTHTPTAHHTPPHTTPHTTEQHWVQVTPVFAHDSFGLQRVSHVDGRTRRWRRRAPDVARSVSSAHSFGMSGWLCAWLAEEEVHEVNDAHWGLERPPPGESSLIPGRVCRGRNLWRSASRSGSWNRSSMWSRCLHRDASPNRSATRSLMCQCVKIWKNVSRWLHRNRRRLAHRMWKSTCHRDWVGGLHVGVGKMAGDWVRGSCVSALEVPYDRGTSPALHDCMFGIAPLFGECLTLKRRLRWRASSHWQSFESFVNRSQVVSSVSHGGHLILEGNLEAAWFCSCLSRCWRHHAASSRRKRLRRRQERSTWLSWSMVWKVWRGFSYYGTCESEWAAVDAAEAGQFPECCTRCYQDYNFRRASKHRVRIAVQTLIDESVSDETPNFTDLTVTKDPAWNPGDSTDAVYTKPKKPCAPIATRVQSHQPSPRQVGLASPERGDPVTRLREQTVPIRRVATESRSRRKIHVSHQEQQRQRSITYELTGEEECGQTHHFAQYTCAWYAREAVGGSNHESPNTLAERKDLHVYLQKADLAVREECAVQRRLSEAEADVETRKWEKKVLIRLFMKPIENMSL